MIYIEYYPLKIAKESIVVPQKYCTHCRANYETGFLFFIKYPAGKKIICVKDLGTVMKTLLLRYQNYNPMDHINNKKTHCECPTCNIEHGQKDFPMTYTEQMKRRKENVRKGEL